MTGCSEKNFEEILEMTGEMEHLAELIRHLSKDREGASPDWMMEKVIHPVLDELESYISSHVSEEISIRELKSLIHGWIEECLNV
ncbi:MAG: hypothetical protein KAW93_09440 [Methanogenium sp.]|nr:hypothetical protein [Methanogenium sp.]